jgi:hypothetical protein
MSTSLMIKENSINCDRFVRGRLVESGIMQKTKMPPDDGLEIGVVRGSENKFTT